MEDTNATPAPVITEFVNGAVVTPVEAKGPIEAITEAVEEPKKPEGNPVAEDKKFGAKFAALGRKEKEQRAARAAFEAEKAAWEKQRTEGTAEIERQKQELAAKYIDPETFKKDPLGLMQKHGLSFEQLAQRVLNDGRPGTEEVVSDTERKLQARLDAFEKKLAEKEEAEKKRTEADKQREFEANMSSFKAQLTDFCNKETDYELIRANDAVGLVYEVIEEHYTNTLDATTGQGQILSNKEAADAVENYLLEEAKKVLNANKVKSLAAQVVAAKAPEGKPSSPTLSNAHSATAAPSKSSKLLSETESLKEAAKLIKWQD